MAISRNDIKQLNMLSLTRTNSENEAFLALVSALDKDLAVRNGEANDFFAPFNKTPLIRNVVLAFNDLMPAGCGAMKEFDRNTAEIKRMFVPPELRGKGIAGTILRELETWAKELGYTRCVLETGDKMPEALALYRKSGYRIIPNYGPYENVESSICFEKNLS